MRVWLQIQVSWVWSQPDPLLVWRLIVKSFLWSFSSLPLNHSRRVVLSCVCYVFVRVCLYVLCGHLLGKGWPLGSRLWCLLWVCHFPIGILGQVWYLIVSIPDLCTLTYFAVSYKQNCVHKVLVNCLFKLALEKVWLGELTVPPHDHSCWLGP